MSSPQQAPEGLQVAGTALWSGVVDVFDLEAHERAVLLQACRTADVLDGLQALVVDEGLMASSSQGARVHPALVELRQQRIVLARLLAALDLPTGVEDATSDAPPVGAPRGVYRLRASS